MPGVAGLVPARFALGLSADFRTTPGLIFFYSFWKWISVMSGGSRADRSALVGTAKEPCPSG